MSKRDDIMKWLKNMKTEDKILLIECLIESEKYKNKYKRINIFNTEPEIKSYDEEQERKNYNNISEYNKNCMFIYGHTKPYDFIEEEAMNDALEDFARDKANQYYK